MQQTLEQIQKQVIGRQLNWLAPVERAALDKEARTAEIAITSDNPIEHWFGTLILNHSAKCIRMGRIKSGAPALLEHDRTQKIGGLLNAKTDGHVLRATVKFSRCEEADREMSDIEDGIPRSISGGFIIHELHLKSEDEQGNRIYQSDDWEPLEASFVTIPADISVGVGRAMKEKCDADEGDEPPAEHPADCECEACMKSRENDSDAETGERSHEQPITRAQETTTPRVESLIERSNNTMNDQEMIAIGERFGEVELAQTFALQGKSVEELRAAILEKRTTRQAPTPKPVVELTEKEEKQFSLSRGILALVDKKGSFELEVSQEIQRKLGVQGRGGFFMPTTLRKPVVERAGLEVKTASAGGRAVFTDYAGFVDLLRNKAMVAQLGATFLPGLVGNISFVNQATAGTAYWVTENPGSDVTQADATITLTTLSPKNLMALTSYSRQLLAQSAFDVDSFVLNDLAKVNALEIDRSILHGASNGLTGIYAESGVNAVAFGGTTTSSVTTGGVPTFAKMVEMETAVAASNADTGTMAYLTTPNMRGLLKTILEFSVNGSKPIWTGGKDDGEVNGYRAAVSNNVCKTMTASAATGGTAHGFVFGAWENVLIGEWGAMEITVDPYTLAAQGMIRVITYMLCDEKLKYAAAFAKGTMATLT